MAPSVDGERWIIGELDAEDGDDDDNGGDGEEDCVTIILVARAARLAANVANGDFPFPGSVCLLNAACDTFRLRQVTIGHWGRVTLTFWARRHGFSGRFAQTIFASDHVWTACFLFDAMVSSIAFVTFDASISLASIATHSLGISAELIDRRLTAGLPAVCAVGSTRCCCCIGCSGNCCWDADVAAGGRSCCVTI